jgi:hypothetical protein
MTEKTTPASSEFPDEAGYPDGTGTLHEGSIAEGTAAEGTAAEGAVTEGAAADDIVDAIEPFDEGDDRDS